MGWIKQLSNWWVSCAGLENNFNIFEDMIFIVIWITFISDLSNYRPVYAPKDLLEVLISLKGPQKQEEDENESV